MTAGLLVACVCVCVDSCCRSVSGFVLRFTCFFTLSLVARCYPHDKPLNQSKIKTAGSHEFGCGLAVILQANWTVEIFTGFNEK